MILKHFISTVVIGLSFVSINANGAVLKAGEDSDAFMQGNRMSLKQLTFHEVPTSVFSNTGSTFNGAQKFFGNRAMTPLSLVDYMNSGSLRRFQTMSSPGMRSSQDTSSFVLTADSSGTVVPVPAAAWLFGSGLLGLVGMARRKARA